MSSIFICIVVAFIISLILISLSKIVSPSVKDFEKVSAFECGFSSFNTTREIVQIRFFLVGLLFVIFDLEISLIVPLNLIIQDIPMTSFWVGVLFILLLTIGLIYEWKKGALN
jgi:NADH-quinone oxidoreductase subunit A